MAKYIVCTDDERYALASNCSSGISIYKKYTSSEFTTLCGRNLSAYVSVGEYNLTHPARLQAKQSVASI